MSDYPIFLHNKAIKALVIGAGNVGLRKVETLLNCGISHVTVIDRKVPDNFPFTKNPTVSFLQNDFTPSHLKGHNLVFIATDDISFNSYVAGICQEKGIFCNVASNPQEGDFTLPALIRKGDILCTLSTGGHSPALSKVLKEEIELILEKGYPELCTFLGDLRPRLLALGLSSEENAACFRTFVTSPLKEELLPYFALNTPEAKKKIFSLCTFALAPVFLPVVEELLC